MKNQFKKLIKIILKKIIKNKYGGFRKFYKFLYWGSFAKKIYKMITIFLNENDVVLDVGARAFPYTGDRKLNKLFGIDLLSDSDGYLGWTNNIFDSNFSDRKIFPVFGSCVNLPFSNKLFDKIVMVEVIEHIKEDTAAIAELARVLKKDGKLFITTPNGLQVENTNPYHIRHYTPEELRKILEKYFNKVNIILEFPNQKLYEKQYLSENSFFIKRVFYNFYYDIWNYFFGKNNSPEECYTIIALCASAKI